MPKMCKNHTQIWLRAFFDCEGWAFNKSHQNRHIGLDSVNKGGLMQINKALDKLKIKSTVKKRNDKKIYSLDIYGKDNILKYQQKINFLHPDKKEKLATIINDYINYYWNFPKDNKSLKKFIREIMLMRAKIKKDSGIIRLISNKKINLVILQKGLKRHFNIESKLNKRKNAIGTVYFQLEINKKNEVKKVIRHKMLSSIEEEKWLTLKK